MYYNWLREASPVVDAAVWTALTLTLVSSGDYFFRLRRLINDPPVSS
jgi:hypothetical protein